MPQARIGGIRVIGGALAILSRAQIKYRLFNMAGQQGQARQALIITSTLVQMQGEAFIPINFNPVDAAVLFRIIDTRGRVFSHFDGKQDILGCDGCAIAPNGIGQQFILYRQPFLAVLRQFRDSRPLVQARQAGT